MSPIQFVKMESLNAQLRAVKQKFPEQNERIEELFEQNNDFRTLCMDYFLCLQYMQKFKEEFSEKHLTLEEYKSIRSELEKELSDSIFKK